MLNGIDVASYQKQLINAKSPIYNAADFVIIKLSEGVSYINPDAKAWASDVYKSGRLLGFYHYARAEKNNAQAEARHFVTAIRSCEPVPHANALLALDFEADAFRNINPDTWAKTFLDAVYHELGTRPLLYVSASQAPQFISVKNGNYGLWVAHWNVKKPAPRPWDFWAIWQYGVLRSPGIDLNIFNGDRAAWLRYGARGLV